MVLIGSMLCKLSSEVNMAVAEFLATKMGDLGRARGRIPVMQRLV
jgi:hypothetical protein